MFQLLEWIKEVLASREQLPAARKALPILTRLAEELNAVVDRLHRKESDPINEIIPFFDAISRVQDTGIINKVIVELKSDPQWTSLISDLEVFNLHLERAGRDRYGMNRSDVDQPVTEFDVYLIGGIKARRTQTVAYIKANRHDAEYYDEMSAVALEFMRGHIKPMLQIIMRFRRVIEPALAGARAA